MITPNASVRKAVIPAAGLGTRLRPLTLHRPKPLVPVCGVPMLSYALALCARHGLTNVIVNAHWLPEQILAWEGDHEGVTVHVAVEAPDILGTGGGLKAVEDRLDERFAIVNADVLCDVDLAALMDAVPEGGCAMALRPHPAEAQERYGVVATDREGVVVDLKELAVTEPVGAVDRSAHFTGIHAMSRSMLRHVPPGFACIVRTATIAEVPHRRVVGVHHTGTWLDVGDPLVYLDTNLSVLDSAVALPLDPFTRAAFAQRDGQRAGDASLVARADIEGPCWVGVGATIGAARLTRCIVGASATVPDGAELTDCVVWDGATVPAGPLARAIVHTGGVLVPGA
mgnify:CR=1 FL=1